MNEKDKRRPLGEKKIASIQHCRRKARAFFRAETFQYYCRLHLQCKGEQNNHRFPEYFFFQNKDFYSRKKREKKKK